VSTQNKLDLKSKELHSF